MEPDEILFERVRQGDLGAFDQLYERYETSLFAYLLATLRDRRDAEEVFHDAFLAALKNAAATTFDEGGFRAWLYRVARNLALNRQRARRRHDRVVASAASDGDASAEAADRALETRELDAALAAAVHRLPNPLGELYHLRANGLTYDQIASVVEVPVGTVKSRVHQMVHALRKELSPWIAPK